MATSEGVMLGVTTFRVFFVVSVCKKKAMDYRQAVAEHALISTYKKSSMKKQIGLNLHK